MFDFYLEAHRVKLFFGFPCGQFFQFSFSRRGSPSRDLVLSRIYPLQQGCFIGHFQGTPFTREFYLGSIHIVLFPRSWWGLNAKLVAPRDYVSSELSPLGDVLSLF